MEKYVAVHTHRFGMSIELFQTDRDITGIDQEEIAKELDFDFENDSDESIELFRIDMDSIKTI